MFYFDCTGFYGSGSHEKPDYPTLQSFIDELDRLGINCALTTHASARDNHCFVGNRQLMADIEAIPGAENRIIPAFAVAPKNFYERENMEYLIEMLSSDRVGALSIYPGSDRFSITHLERLFDKISCYSPVVLLDCFEIMDGRNGNNAFGYESLIAVAKKYPNMPFIIRDGMWGDCGYIFDAMWRCDNIYADISRLHVQDIIPNIRRNIGLGRVVFGSGYRALCGASIAALRYSGENEAEQRRIAGERLMSLMPNKDEMKRLRKNLTELTPMIQNRFWTEYLRGEGIRSYEIIDVHTHLSTATSQGWFVEKATFDDLITDQIARARQLGVDHMIASGTDALMSDPFEGNRFAENKSNHVRNEISLYYTYNPIYADRLTIEEMNERFATGAYVGIKTLADYWRLPVTDPSYTPAWEYASKHRLPILFHSWEGTCDYPDLIAEVAEKYPDAIFLIGHSGGGDIGRLQAERAALRLPNVYLEYCGSFCAKRNWRDTLDVVGADRVVFGSDTQGHDQAWELGRLLSEKITDAELELILSRNIKRILAMRR